MRHRGRADFTFFELLTEEVHGDVAPDIAVKVNEDGVGALDFLKEFGHVIMRLDLNRMGVEHCAQTFFNNFFREGFPIEVRIGNQVCVVIADGSVHLGEDLHGLDGFNDACKADCHIGEFLADGRG